MLPIRTSGRRRDYHHLRRIMYRKGVVYVEKHTTDYFEIGIDEIQIGKCKYD